MQLYANIKAGLICSVEPITPVFQPPRALRVSMPRNYCVGCEQNFILLIIIIINITFHPYTQGGKCMVRICIESREALLVTSSTSYNGSLKLKSTESVLIVSSTRGLCIGGSAFSLFITGYSSPFNSPPPQKLPTANIYISICVVRIGSVMQ